MTQEHVKIIASFCIIMLHICRCIPVKNKSWFPVHFALIAMQLWVWAFRTPSGIEPMTLVPAGLAHDHKTREES